MLYEIFNTPFLQNVTAWTNLGALYLDKGEVKVTIHLIRFCSCLILFSFMYEESMETFQLHLQHETELKCQFYKHHCKLLF